MLNLSRIESSLGKYRPWLALDRSMRHYDEAGRLHIEQSNISKACVNPYWGREIPDAQALGLAADKKYYMLRDPAELQAAADTFKNIPLLIIHQPISADQPAQKLVVGVIGNDVAFKAPYLCADLAVWTSEAISAIESGKQQQLSAGYWYRADMTPGVFEGQRYDGIMRDIRANHVALVTEGRAGPDVIVQDNLPLELKMRYPKIIARLKPFLAADADIAALDAELAAAAAADDADETDEEKAARLKREAKDKKAADKKAAEDKAAADKAAADARAAADEDDDDDEKKRKAADKKAADKKAAADIKAAADAAGIVTRDELPALLKQAEDKAVARTNALHVARSDVAPLVGVVAMDSAEEVYKFALEQLKVETKDIHPSAFPALLAMAKEKRAVTRIAPQMGFDAAAAADTEKAFNLSRIKRA